MCLWFVFAYLFIKIIISLLLGILYVIRMNKERIVTFRVTRKEYKQMKVMAGFYSHGDVSTWIRYCLDEYTPKMLRKRKRGKK